MASMLLAHLGMKPADVVLVGAGLIAVLLFIGGLVDVFGVPVKAKRRRRRKPVRQQWEAGRRLMNLVAGALLPALILGIIVLRDGRAVSIEPRHEPAGLSRQQPSASSPREDYERAARRYQEALRARPDDVSLWYALGVTLTHLDRRKDAEEAFQYVVRHGKPDSQEVRFARRWLVSTGALPPSVASTRPAPVSQATDGTAAAVHGKVTWGGLESQGPSVRVRILLHGVSGAGEGQRFSERVGLGEGYRFEGLPSGSYRLIGRVEGGALLWDQRVDVQEGEEIAFDLSRENSNNPSVAVR